MKGAVAMYDYKWKKWGFIVSGVGLALMLAEKVKGFVIFKKLDVTQHYGIFEWIMLFGLVMVIYCREKYDDDRAKAIRLKSLQMAFLLTLSVMMAMAFTGTLAKDLTLGPPELFLISAMGIVLYLMVFHIGLYFDFLWDFGDRGVLENLRNIGKNIWGIMVYLLVSMTMLVALTFLL